MNSGICGKNIRRLLRLGLALSVLGVGAIGLTSATAQAKTRTYVHAHRRAHVRKNIHAELRLRPLQRLTLAQFCSFPTVTSVSPTSASPGATVVVTGQNFGSSQRTGFLAFSDNGMNWGAPNVAPVTTVSWSNTQIVFDVPTVFGEWSTRSGTEATVTVVTPARSPLSAMGCDSNKAGIAMTSPAPSITSVSPATAGPGATVVVDGQNFGTSQGAYGFLHFSDDGVNWGAPGNTAPFTLLSWGDNQIVFDVPTPDGSWGTVGDTEASVQVTSATGLYSNQVDIMMSSGAQWPISANSAPIVTTGTVAASCFNSGGQSTTNGWTEIDNNSNQWMYAAVNINSSGGLTANSLVCDQYGDGGGPSWNFLGTSGFHGATVVTLYNQSGVQIDQWETPSYGVSGAQTNADNWSDQLSTSDLLSAYKISVVNVYDPQGFNLLNWIAQNQAGLQAAATIIEGAFAAS
jgi:hypothetical protein